MALTKAYVETSVLVEAILSGRPEAARANKSLARYQKTLLPDYAVKELRKGVLSYWVWLHNVLADCKSVKVALGRIGKIYRQRYRQAAATQALQCETISRTVGQYNDKYGSMADVELAYADEIRLAVKNKIYEAWESKDSITTHRVDFLDCFSKGMIQERRGQIVLDQIRCNLDSQECCIAEKLRSRHADVEVLLDCLTKLPAKEERTRTITLLKKILHDSRFKMKDKDCRALGDAYFVLFSPEDSSILTKNVADFTATSAALGKSLDINY